MPFLCAIWWLRLLPRRVFYTLALVGWLASSSTAQAQFLSRAYFPLWMEDYENYALSGYRDALQPIVVGKGTSLGNSYGSSSVAGYFVEQERSTYDPFGNYLVDGLDVFRLEEYRTVAPDNGSLLFKSNLYNRLFQNLVIVRDTYKGWSSRFIIGDAVRTKFSPLTLDLARLNGLRWDAASQKNRFSVVASRISDPITELGGLAEPRSQPFSSYLLGGRWETTLGGLLTWGASWSTLFQMDTLVRDGAGRKGVVPSSLAGPQALFVVISDDSPQDGRGALVYALEMLVNGQPSGQRPEGKRIRNLIDSKVFKREEDKYPLPLASVSFLRQDGPWALNAADRSTEGQNSAYFNVLNTDPRTGNVGLFADGEPVDLAAARPVEVAGTDLLIFRFEHIPAGTKEVSFRALVANDYNIDVATGLGRVKTETLVWDDWHNVERAPGNIQDGSNLRWVKFNYSFPTGISTVAFDLKAKILGATISAEAANNASYYRFPAREGSAQTRSRFAYYANISRPVARGDVSLEVFAIPSAYTTSLALWSNAANRPVVFDLVDDNDDRDEWADSGDVDGVFPGLDADGDGVIDTNVNANNLPDYLEPFIMYYVDPDDFVFGDDFNHNGVVDVRENDNTADYPYDRDSRGQHAFASFVLPWSIRFTAGGYDIHQPTTGGRNRAAYGLLEYTRRAEHWGLVQAAFRSQRVQDDIADDLAASGRFSGLEGAGFVTDITSSRGQVLDGLSTKNSLVHTAFVHTAFTRLKNLGVVNSLKWERNGRRAAVFPDGTSQGRETEGSWAFVHKADYPMKAGNFTLTPMYKFLWQRRVKPSSGQDPFYAARHLVPILKLDYHFTPSTLFRVGFQGFPGLKERYKETSAPYAAFAATSQVFLLQNKGNYSGFDLFLNMGYRQTRRDFSTWATARSVSEGEYFIQVFTE